MIRINLLPHREAKRKKRQQEFYAMLGGAFVFGAAIIAAGAMFISAEIDAQQDRNSYLKAEIEKLDAEIKEIATLKQEIDALKARQSAVENLQADRTMPVQLLDQLVRLTPEGLYLRGIKQDGLKVALSGHAQSNERVSELLRSLSTQPQWIERSDLVEIKAVQVGTNPKDTKRLFEFTVVAMLKRPDAGNKPGAGPQKVAAAQ